MRNVKIFGMVGGLKSKSIDVRYQYRPVKFDVVGTSD